MLDCAPLFKECRVFDFSLYGFVDRFVGLLDILTTEEKGDLLFLSHRLSSHNTLGHAVNYK